MTQQTQPGSNGSQTDNAAERTIVSYAPVSGEVIEINVQLEDAPETINADPYIEGWFFKLQPSDPGELDDLLSADEYREQCDDE